VLKKWLNDDVDVIKDVDYHSMHGIALNVALHFIQYWFSEQYENQLFSLFENVEKANQMLKEYKVPHSNSRKPQKLEKIKKWKASELRLKLC
jgi:hypothetical protein